jgi:hypothetical protein
VSSSSEFYIFRDSRRSVLAADLVSCLAAELRQMLLPANADALISLLLRAGDLETALSDAPATIAVCGLASRLTNLFADALVQSDSTVSTGDSRWVVSSALPILDEIHYAGLLSVGIPEGFAYYAIHPLDYSDLIARVKVGASPALVVGVRSIGATLSAVVAAKLRQLDFAAERVTVRPVGRPYDRTCRFEPTQRKAVERSLADGAEFFVCDEGPGRSGSSLLSVAEALEREGVPRSSIVILCAYEPDANRLCAPDAVQRWGRFRVAAAGLTRRLPADSEEYLGGGAWRRNLITYVERWPAVWPEMERLRYGSSDGAALLTFEGHGQYGAAVRTRNQALSDAGFGPAYLGQEAGFGRKPIQQGASVSSRECTADLLTHLARYCAWRAREFAVTAADTSELETMVRANYEREFGVPQGIGLLVEMPTVCDTRMMPHEWLHTHSGRWLKLDAAIHGDDHFFPGPCDIAWDLAGIVVEWELSHSAREFLLAEYRQASGDDAASRIVAYEMAYNTFRMAWSKMAGASTGDRDEELRLSREYRRYREFLQHATSHVVGLSESCHP